MREELDNLLCSKYPKIFKDRHASTRDSAMAFGFPDGDGWFSIIDQLCSHIQKHIDNRIDHNDRCKGEVKLREACKQDDWSEFDNIYSYWRDNDPAHYQRKREEMFQPIPHWLEEKPEIPQVVAQQVKQKFGRLCFYITGGDEHIRGLITMAEGMSAVMCEECGALAQSTRTETGWLRTLCAEHAKSKDSE